MLTREDGEEILLWHDPLTVQALTNTFDADIINLGAIG